MTEIRSINKLCFLLGTKKEYVFDLVNRVEDCYHSYNKKIRREDGTIKIRHIDSPNFELKNVQKKINNIIIRPQVDLLPDYVHGARNKKSITTNAAAHVGKEAVLSLDITDCFPSIEAKRVYYTFKNILSCSNKVAFILTALTTKDGVLPQGCPTSASLCNLVLAHMLGNMSKIGNKLSLDMSHYIDDIFYSGECEDLHRIRNIVITEIGKSGLKPNLKKVKIYKNNYAIKVTGVTTNVKMSANRRRIRKIEREILRIRSEDKSEYYKIKEKRKTRQLMQCKVSIKACKIERLLGEISNVASINKKQGQRLRKKLRRKLDNLQ